MKLSELIPQLEKIAADYGLGEVTLTARFEVVKSHFGNRELEGEYALIVQAMDGCYTGHGDTIEDATARLTGAFEKSGYAKRTTRPSLSEEPETA